jgi:hypothetical protein
MKEVKTTFAEVVFPSVMLVVGVHFQSAAFVVAALLTFVFVYSVAYYLSGNDGNHETFAPLFPLVGALGVALFFHRIANATALHMVLVLTAFVANYLVTFPLALRILRRANDEFATNILGILMSVAGLLVAAVLLWKELETAAIVALVATIFALPYQPIANIFALPYQPKRREVAEEDEETGEGVSLKSIGGLLAAALLLWKGLDASAILALILFTLAPPFPPKRGGDDEEDTETGEN